MVSHSPKYRPDFKKRKYNPLYDDKGSNSDMLKELDTDSDDKMGLETEGETASKKNEQQMLMGEKK
jgi:hypothetical protein